VLPVFGTDEMLVPPERFSDVLQPGAIIEVVFTLKHWPFFDKGVPKSDTFGAHLEMINILKNAPPPVQSPYRARARRPLHIPQTPSTPSRGELKRAAAAFFPDKVEQPIFTSGPSSSSGSSGTVTASTSRSGGQSPTKAASEGSSTTLSSSDDNSVPETENKASDGESRWRLSKIFFADFFFLT